MDDKTETLLLEGFSKIDLLEIQESSKDIEMDLHPIEVNEKTYGEPGTIMAIIAVGTIALPAIIIWLIKHRIVFKTTEKEKFTLPDGTVVEKSVSVKYVKSGPPTPEVIEAAKKYVPNPTDLSDALKSAEQ